MCVGGKKVVITGAAGFIGSHLSRYLFKQGYRVICIDNLKPSYQGNLCYIRQSSLWEDGMEVLQVDLASTFALEQLSEIFLDSYSVIHLAAWPGVRNGQEHPFQYSKNNVIAFCNVLEAVRLSEPDKFLFASSSSIYGNQATRGPVREIDADGKQILSFYGGTKWANEVLAQQFASLSAVPTIALRFFTVYGSLGRPDMAYWQFAEKVLAGKSIQLYGEDGGVRDFTYVLDACAIIARLLSLDLNGYSAVNVACGRPLKTMQLVDSLFDSLGRKTKIESVSRPPVDATYTWSDTSYLESLIGPVPYTPLDEGIAAFSNWFKDFVQE